MRAAVCLHCSSAIPTGSESTGFCCSGCEAVFGLIHAQGLGRYYTLAQGQVAPVALSPDRSLVWLEPLLVTASACPGAMKSIELDVQGIHCAACVWLFNETFARRGGAAITVNPSIGRVRLQWVPEQLDLGLWVKEIEAFGYALGPARKQALKGSSELPLRLGISAAITLNVMLFSLSFYFGLAPSDGDVFTIFSRLSLVLSTAVVLIGGWPFFRGAVRGLQSRVLHLDLPIALGILLVWGTSLVQAQGGDRAYFDTLNVFITLMLFGRWLQQRVLERNRRFLLEDDGAQGLFSRRRQGSAVEVVPAPRLAAGDRLLIAPGELIPIDARVEGAAVVSTDWINGESSPRQLTHHELAPAGSFNAGRTAFEAEALTDFAQSPLVSLLRQPAARAGAQPRHVQFWNRLARRWVAQVLLAAGIGFLLWLPAGTARALDVAVALLVVTCPCAIGIALPLAYELTQARLRRRGFYVRSTDLLDRLTDVTTLVFDKTGTLTLGHLALATPAAVDRLSTLERDVLWNLVCRSSHPVSVCLHQALCTSGAAFDPDAAVVEQPGQGMQWRRADGDWRLGKAQWASAGVLAADPVFSRDGQRVTTFATREALRPDAGVELKTLERQGYPAWLLSGDSPARVSALASRLGLSPDHALGALSPEQKAEHVAALGPGTLYLGDGVNDAPAFGRALCAGTPAIERPVMPSRSDFFLVGAGLAPLRDALSSARRLRTVVKRVLGLSVAYNAVAVVVALAGWMSPVKAAIFMPLSSLTLLLITVVSLSERSRAPAPAQPVEVPA